MKAHFWAFADSAGLGLQDLSRGAHKEPVPFFSVTKCLRQWMLHPVLSKVIVEVSNAKTLPFLSGTPRPVPSVITCMADGTEWLSPPPSDSVPLAGHLQLLPGHLFTK